MVPARELGLCFPKVMGGLFIPHPPPPPLEAKSSCTHLPLKVNYPRCTAFMSLGRRGGLCGERMREGAEM